jgi:hypothetical protein
MHEIGIGYRFLGHRTTTTSTVQSYLVVFQGKTVHIHVLGRFGRDRDEGNRTGTLYLQDTVVAVNKHDVLLLPLLHDVERKDDNNKRQKVGTSTLSLIRDSTPRPSCVTVYSEYWRSTILLSVFED